MNECACACAWPCACVIMYIYIHNLLIMYDETAIMFSTDLGAFHGDQNPCVRRSFLRCDGPDVSHCHHFGEITSLAHSRLRWSTPYGWPDSRTWHRNRPLTRIRHSWPHTARLWRRSSRNWCCRSCRRRRCWRGHSRRRQNMSRPRPHTATWLRFFLDRKSRL